MIFLYTLAEKCTRLVYTICEHVHNKIQSFFDIRFYWSIMDLANFRSLRLNMKYESE